MAAYHLQSYYLCLHFRLFALLVCRLCSGYSCLIPFRVFLLHRPYLRSPLKLCSALPCYLQVPLYPRKDSPISRFSALLTLLHLPSFLKTTIVQPFPLSWYYGDKPTFVGFATFLQFRYTSLCNFSFLSCCFSYVISEPCKTSPGKFARLPLIYQMSLRTKTLRILHHGVWIVLDFYLLSSIVRSTNALYVVSVRQTEILH